MARTPLVLIYTAAGNPTVQGIASSIDGRNFTKYPGNPVLPQITGGNRDPKVLWHEPTKRWVMVLYVGLPENRHTVHFFTSPNLRDWTLASVTEGVAGSNFLYECPDFFELPVDGDAARSQWVLLAANSEHAIGSFDGVTFRPEHRQLPGHRGRGFYAAQSFSDIPKHDGRRILIGWFQTETKGMPFNQSMTIPLELKLTATAAGPRMTFTPVKELESLRAKTHRVPPMTLTPDSANPLAGVRAELLEIRAEFEPGEAREVIFTVRGATVLYDTGKQELVVNGHRSPAPLRDGKQRLTIFCDRTGLEVFASDGLTYVPMPFLAAVERSFDRRRRERRPRSADRARTPRTPIRVADGSPGVGGRSVGRGPHRTPGRPTDAPVDAPGKRPRHLDHQCDWRRRNPASAAALGCHDHGQNPGSQWRRVGRGHCGRPGDSRQREASPPSKPRCSLAAGSSRPPPICGSLRSVAIITRRWC